MYSASKKNFSERNEKEEQCVSGQENVIVLLLYPFKIFFLISLTYTSKSLYKHSVGRNS